MSNTPSWFAFRKRREAARVKLYCLPYAGGSASIFREWFGHLPDSIEPVPVELPGRGIRIREKPFVRMRPIVNALADAINNDLDRPFALYGHSMGALVGWQVATTLTRDFGRIPLCLAVGASSPPSDPARARRTLHRASDEIFIDYLRKLNGTPKEVIDDAELIQMLLPAIRADFEVIETYEEGIQTPAEFPIVAFSGRDDPSSPPEAMEAWRGYTRSLFRLNAVDSGHFFLSSQRQKLVAQLSAEILTLLHCA